MLLRPSSHWQTSSRAYPERYASVRWEIPRALR